MHFWIDKRSQTYGFGRARVAASLSGGGLGFGHHPRRGKPMVTPIHRFQPIESRPYAHRNYQLNNSHQQQQHTSNQQHQSHQQQQHTSNQQHQSHQQQQQHQQTNNHHHHYHQNQQSHSSQSQYNHRTHNVYHTRNHYQAQSVQHNRELDCPIIQQM